MSNTRFVSDGNNLSGRNIFFGVWKTSKEKAKLGNIIHFIYDAMYWSISFFFGRCSFFRKYLNLKPHGALECRLWAHCLVRSDPKSRRIRYPNTRKRKLLENTQINWRCTLQQIKCNVVSIHYTLHFDCNIFACLLVYSVLWLCLLFYFFCLLLLTSEQTYLKYIQRFV